MYEFSAKLLIMLVDVAAYLVENSKPDVFGP